MLRMTLLGEEWKVLPSISYGDLRRSRPLTEIDADTIGARDSGSGTIFSRFVPSREVEVEDRSVIFDAGHAHDDDLTRTLQMK